MAPFGGPCYTDPRNHKLAALLNLGAEQCPNDSPSALATPKPFLKGPLPLQMFLHTCTDPHCARMMIGSPAVKRLIMMKFGMIAISIGNGTEILIHPYIALRKEVLKNSGSWSRSAC